MRPLLGRGRMAGECLDGFDDRVGATATGRAPSGQSWVQLPNPSPAAGCGILAGQAYTSISAAQKLVVDTGFSDGSVQATFATLGAASTSFLIARVPPWLWQNATFTGLAARADATSWKLFRFTAGGSTTLINNTTVTPASGDVVKLVMRGAALELFVNGASVGTATDGQCMNATLHGFLISGDTTARMDAFKTLRI